jgi:predicted DsbA family dithiol-disulfide isomerase
VLAAALIWPAVGVAQEKQPPDPAPKVMEFVVRALAWYPNSIFELVSNTTFQTPSGSYRFVEVARTCASRLLTGKPTMLVLPEALNASMGLKVELEWDVGPRRPGALIPFYLLVDSGYGKYRRRAAFTADGKYLVMAAEMPLDEDPVVYRRRILAASDQVIWDVESGENAPVEIVEFSDLECPACRGKWPLIDMVLKKYQGKVRHGMASYPLTAIHPWAFRAASASWCVSLQNPRALVPFKETFYSLQREMEVSLVTPTSIDFVNGRGLDESAFRECYLRPPSIDAVHQQLSLGQGMGVNATPTYFVNGWRIQVPEGAWFPAFIETLLKGEEP